MAKRSVSRGSRGILKITSPKTILIVVSCSFCYKIDPYVSNKVPVYVSLDNLYILWFHFWHQTIMSFYLKQGDGAWGLRPIQPLGLLYLSFLKNPTIPIFP